jgi:hypothetical protein
VASRRSAIPLHRRTVVSVAGVVAVVLLAVLLLTQVPAATALGSRTARAHALRAEAASLSSRTTSLTGLETSAKQRLVVVTTDEKRVHGRERVQRTTIAGLRKQVASLNRDISSLGG